MSGFLPQERQWFSDLLQDGWHDVFREKHGQGEEVHWWSNRGQARAKERLANRLFLTQRGSEYTSYRC